MKKAIYIIFVQIILIGCNSYSYKELEKKGSDSSFQGNDMHLIFDFDGTIADTHSLAVQELNKLSDEYGINKVSLEWSKDYSMKEVLDTAGVKWYQLYFLAKDLKQEMKKNIKLIKAFDDIKNVLINLKNKGYTLGIMTSNSVDLVDEFLKLNDIHSFDYIYSGSSLFGKDKLIEKVIEQQEIKNALYIGDEARDIEAMKKANIPIIAVSWGWNSKKLLEEYNPDHLVDKPSELNDIVEKL
ncbi:MAG: HAD-IA family hydrolase [Oligoflexales bacterium]